MAPARPTVASISPRQTFSIDVALYHPLHNRLKATNVTDDTYTVAEDALAIINDINDHGSGPVDTSRFNGSQALTTAAPKIFYYDVVDDNWIAPDDVLTVINYINANPGPETEAPSTFSLPDDTLLLLLATDLATQSNRRK